MCAYNGNIVKMVGEKVNTQPFIYLFLTSKYINMGQFKDVGIPAAALAEECAEVIQVITKLMRFGGYWDEIPPGKDHSRWMDLVTEMNDVLYQWERLKEAYDRAHNPTESWDGDNSP